MHRRTSEKERKGDESGRKRETGIEWEIMSGGEVSFERGRWRRKKSDE